MTVNKLVLTRGNVASGKTTYAIAWVEEDPKNRVNVNRDDIRFSMFNRPVLEHHEEELVTRIQVAMVKEALSARKSVIVSDTNLHAKTVKAWLAVARQVGVEVEFVDFNTPLDDCLRYNHARMLDGGRYVPEEVIRSMYGRYFVKGKLPAPPVLEEGGYKGRTYVPDASLPPAYIFDVDGTTQLNLGGRGFYEWHRVAEDVANESVIDVAKRLHASGADIIVVSGRDAVCYNDTMNNLLLHGMPVTAMYMRPKGSLEKDAIVKERIFFNDIAPKWNVLGTFDDRKQVVEFWRSIGLTCFAVAEGDF